MDTILSAATRHINQFPKELLGECFAFLPLGDRIRSATICEHWRAVALDHAQLWCDLNNVSMAALPHLLARTKDVGVRVTARTVLDASIAPLCQAILPHMHHVRVLDLELYPARNQQSFTAVENILRAQAPALEEFSLVIHKLRMTLNRPLFADVAPLLRSLRMDGWTFTTANAATANLASFQAPGVVHTAQGIVSPFYTRNWAGMFPALRVLHLTQPSQTAGLWTGQNPLSPHLNTLVLEFGTDASVSNFTDAFRLLEAANFANMREVTLVYAKAVLVELVLQSLGDTVVSMELTDNGGPHIRLVTDTGTATNFMCARGLGLDEAVLENATRLAHLRTLHLGADVLHTFGGRTITRICRTARGLERLVLTGVPDAEKWEGSEPLDLRALRELRIQGPAIQAHELAAFVYRRLRLRPPPEQPTLIVAGVEISGYAPSIAQLNSILHRSFGEISVIPAPRAEATQRAEMFVRSPE